VFATLFEWTLQPDREDDFTSAWEEATRELRTLGSEGSALFRADDGRLVGVARWPDRATRDAAFEQSGKLAFERMADCLAAPTRRVDLHEVSNLWADYREP
jgi:hypothetical protein